MKIAKQIVKETREQILEKILEDFLIAVIMAVKEAQARIAIDCVRYAPNEDI
jgi:hypothetical protein